MYRNFSFLITRSHKWYRSRIIYTNRYSYNDKEDESVGLHANERRKRHVTNVNREKRKTEKKVAVGSLREDIGKKQKAFFEPRMTSLYALFGSPSWKCHHPMAIRRFSCIPPLFFIVSSCYYNLARVINKINVNVS